LRQRGLHGGRDPSRHGVGVPLLPALQRRERRAGELPLATLRRPPRPGERRGPVALADLLRLDGPELARQAARFFRAIAARRASLNASRSHAPSWRRPSMKKVGVPLTPLRTPDRKSSRTRLS